MRRRDVLGWLGSAAVVHPLSIRAQQARKIPRIGFLGAISPPRYVRQVEALRSGLRDLGYFEGENILIEFRWAEGSYDRLAEFAAEFEHLKVDVLVTHGTPGTMAAKRAAPNTAIVAAAIGDPVATGVVSGIAQPGGNITGLAHFSPELSVKRVEILTQSLPHLKRAAILLNPDNALVKPILVAVEAAANSFGVAVQRLEVRGPSEFSGVLSSLANVEGLVVVDDAMLIAHAQAVGELASSQGVPAIGFTEFAHGGGLLGCGVNFLLMFRRAAVFVDRILKGARPADLPVEQATHFELVINMKTAKALNLTIPPTLLARADEVIE
jgi:putative tryptophan/tyrosine transport system substrate-binding protein